MSKLYIAEFSGAQTQQSGGAPVVSLPPIAEQVVDFSGGAAVSAAFSNSTTLIRIESDATCSIKVGPTPVATTANSRVAGDSPEYFGVTPGQKISAIANT